MLSGMTLLAIACASSLEKGLPEQVRYLLKNKRANPSIADVNGNTAVSLSVYHKNNPSVTDVNSNIVISQSVYHWNDTALPTVNGKTAVCQSVYHTKPPPNIKVNLYII